MVGCLVVLAWKTPDQVHSQSAMFATGDDVGEILLATIRGHEIDDPNLSTGHA
jgi:hypothetical protein